MAMHTPEAAAAGTFPLGDLEVRRMAFGAMRLTGEGVWGPPPDRARALRVLRQAVHELGVNLIDTADSYGPHVDEELIAEALHPYPEGLVVATKGGLERPGPGRWEENGRPEHLREACEGSLRRLRLERIDVYQLHAPDPAVPVEDSLGELVRLREEGKIRHVAISNFDEPEELERALSVTPFVSVQNRYSLTDRHSDPVVDWCEAHGVGFLPWRPVAGAMGSRAVRRVAKRHGATPAQIALAWLLHRSSAVLPIPGTSSPEHLRENVEAASIRLGAEDLRELSREG